MWYYIPCGITEFSRVNRQLLGAGKGDSPLKPPEGTLPCQHLDFNPVRPISDSGSQNCKIIHVCCYKPRSLW